MAQRVGWVSGGKAKRDHFPLLMQNQLAAFRSGFNSVSDYLAFDYVVSDETGLIPKGDGTQYPWGMDPKLMMRWFALVRTWHLRVDANFVWGKLNDPDDLDSGSHWEFGSVHVEFDRTNKYDRILSGLPPFVAPDEVRQSCSPLDFGSGSCEIGINADESYEVVDVDNPRTPQLENISISISNPPETWDPAEWLFGLLWTQGVCRGGFVDGDFWPPNVLSLTGPGLIASSIKVEGEDVSDPFIYFKGNWEADTVLDTSMWSPDPGSSDPATNGSTQIDSVDAAVTPKAFWPFANSQGDPVYDETTGEQLVDPFS